MFDISPMLSQSFSTFATAKNSRRDELKQIYLNLEKEKSKTYDPVELKKIQKKVDEAYKAYSDEDDKENARLDKLLAEKMSKRKW